MSLNKECIENKDTRRFFTGSKKDKGDSEIFGMKNILYLASDEDSCLTKNIFKVKFSRKEFRIIKNWIIQRELAVERGLAGLEVSSYVQINKDLEVADETNVESPVSDPKKSKEITSIDDILRIIFILF